MRKINKPAPFIIYIFSLFYLFSNIEKDQKPSHYWLNGKAYVVDKKLTIVYANSALNKKKMIK